MTLRQFFKIVEARTKIVGLSSFAVGTLYAVYREADFSPPLFLLMLLAVLSVDMGTTALNTFYDYARGVDTWRHNREADKVLVHEGVAPGVALLVSAGLFLAAAPLGIVIGILSSPWIIVVGAASMLVGVFYNAGRRPLSRTPLGELFAGVFLGGVLVVLSYCVHSGELSTDAMLASLPSTLIIASILTTNNTCDVEGDRKAKRRTLAVVLGANRSRWLIYVQGLGAYAVVAALTAEGVFPPTAWAAVAIGVPTSLMLYRRMHRIGYSHETKGRSMEGVIRVFTVFTVLLCGSLGLSTL